ncbi:unnamed protein product [marine sediment metagenome]|uniref:Uncharacterized protein n=1 Tax=marine sediment metagenome TaxID=412755 RepID=X1R6M8_9ZZZZ
MTGYGIRLSGSGNERLRVSKILYGKEIEAKSVKEGKMKFLEELREKLTHRSSNYPK